MTLAATTRPTPTVWMGLLPNRMVRCAPRIGTAMAQTATPATAPPATQSTRLRLIPLVAVADFAVIMVAISRLLSFRVVSSLGSERRVAVDLLRRLTLDA
jgi:hypothetical protein